MGLVSGNMVLHGQRCGNEVCGKAIVCTSVFLIIPRRSPVGAAMTSHFFCHSPVSHFEITAGDRAGLRPEWL